MEKKLPVVGISQGDINGIGYEVILKTLADPIIFDIIEKLLTSTIWVLTSLKIQKRQNLVKSM